MEKLHFKNTEEFYQFFVETDGEFDEEVTFEYEGVTYLFNEEHYNYLLKEYGSDVLYCVAENDIKQMLKSEIITKLKPKD